MRLAERMQTNVRTIAPEASIAELVQSLADSRVSGLLVVAPRVEWHLRERLDELLCGARCGVLIAPPANRAGTTPSTLRPPLRSGHERVHARE